MAWRGVWTFSHPAYQKYRINKQVPLESDVDGQLLGGAFHALSENTYIFNDRLAREQILKMR